MNVNGAHNVHPDKISNSAIPNAPANAPFFGPNKIAIIKSMADPKWTSPPFAAIGKRILIKNVATNTSEIRRLVIIKSFVFSDEVEIERDDSIIIDAPLLEIISHISNLLASVKGSKTNNLTRSEDLHNIIYGYDGDCPSDKLTNKSAANYENKFAAFFK